MADISFSSRSPPGQLLRHIICCCLSGERQQLMLARPIPPPTTDSIRRLFVFAGGKCKFKWVERAPSAGVYKSNARRLGGSLCWQLF